MCKALVVFIDVLQNLIEREKRTAIEYGSFKKSLEEGVLTFYNWECPIRSDLRSVDELEYECDWVDDVDRTRMVQLAEIEADFARNILLPLKRLGVKVNSFLGFTLQLAAEY